MSHSDIFSHAINRTENKGKEIEKKIHIDLVVIASQWSELAVHDRYLPLIVRPYNDLTFGRNQWSRNTRY